MSATEKTKKKYHTMAEQNNYINIVDSLISSTILKRSNKTSMSIFSNKLGVEDDEISWADIGKLFGSMRRFGCFKNWDNDKNVYLFEEPNLKKTKEFKHWYASKMGNDLKNILQYYIDGKLEYQGQTIVLSNNENDFIKVLASFKNAFCNINDFERIPNTKIFIRTRDKEKTLDDLILNIKRKFGVKKGESFPVQKSNKKYKAIFI